jgi:hypothetical protein
VGFNPTQ